MCKLNKLCKNAVQECCAWKLPLQWHSSYSKAETRTTRRFSIINEADKILAVAQKLSMHAVRHACNLPAFTAQRRAAASTKMRNLTNPRIHLKSQAELEAVQVEKELETVGMAQCQPDLINYRIATNPETRTCPHFAAVPILLVRKLRLLHTFMHPLSEPIQSHVVQFVSLFAIRCMASPHSHASDVLHLKLH